MATAVKSSDPAAAALSDFQFHSLPWIGGYQATYFGQQVAELFISIDGADRAEAIEKGIEQLLSGMQLTAEKIGGNAYTSFELTTDHNSEKDGAPGVLLRAQGCVTRLESRW